MKCNQCHEEMISFFDGEDTTIDYVGHCKLAGCPNYGLLQMSEEKMLELPE